MRYRYLDDFDAVFRYLPFFLTVLRYWVPPNVPLMKTTSYLEEPNHQFCQHFMRRATQQTFSAINLASQQKTTKLFFSSQVRKQFKLLAVVKSLRCCLRSNKLVNCHVWKFYGDLFLNCRVSSWPDLSIKLYFLQRLPLTRALKGFFLQFKPAFWWTSINRYRGFSRVGLEKILSPFLEHSEEY